MKVKVNLSNQTLEYMDSQPYIQGTDTRNKLDVYIEHSTIPQTEGAFNIMIAYALQNGRTTIKMANTGATSETIDDVLYDIFYFTAPKVLTSISGNFVATLILKVESNTYKVNVLNTVLNAVDFEAFEDALDDVSSEFIETIEALSGNVTQLQNDVIDLQTYKADLTNANQTITSKELVTKFISYEDGREDITLSSGSVSIAFQTENETYNYLEVNGSNVLLGSNNDESQVVVNSTGAYLDVTRADGGANIVEARPNAVRLKLNPEGGNNTILDLNDNGVFFTIPSGDSFKVNNVDIPNKTYVDTADSGLQTQITALNNEIGYVELTGSSGTLTNTQMLEIEKPYCIIKQKDSVLSTESKVFYKNAYNTNTLYYDFVDSNLTYIENNNKISVALYHISINVNTNGWGKSRTGIYYKFYDTDNIDSKVTNLQTQIDGINAGQNLADIVANLTALNNLDTTKLQSGDKVEVLSDSDHDNVSTVYNWSGTIWQYIGAYGMDAYTKAQMDSALALKQNVISSSNKISSDYVDDTNGVDHKFVTQAEIDEFTAKQDALVETDSTAVSGGGVVVKDSYIESTFFATDLEVQNMLSEVFE